MPALRHTVAAAVLVLAVLGCSAGEQEPVAQGLVAEIVISGLRGPTQIAHHPDGRLLVAEIGAGEGTPTGTVSAIDLADPEQREVLAEGLDTPTGVTVADGRLWVMERTRLVVAPLAGGPVVVVFDQLPSNGRSNGTILTLSDGDLLFDTSGRRRGSGAETGSGTLWRLDPGDVAADGTPAVAPGTFGTAVLTGMKHAYAVAELGDGRLAVTEVSDGRFDGEPAPDEVVIVPAAADPADGASDTPTGGWPRCVGDRQPVQEFGGTPQICASAVPSVALFPAGATPTGIAIDPADPGRILVALWNTDQVVSVPLDPAGDSSPAGDSPPGGDSSPAGDSSPGGDSSPSGDVAADAPQPRVVAAEIANPQHLLVDGDAVLVSGHRDGQVIALRRAGVAPADG